MNLLNRLFRFSSNVAAKFSSVKGPAGPVGQSDQSTINFGDDMDKKKPLSLVKTIRGQPPFVLPRAAILGMAMASKVQITSNDTSPEAAALVKHYEQLWSDNLYQFLQAMEFGSVSFAKTKEREPNSMGQFFALDRLPNDCELVTHEGAIAGVKVKADKEPPEKTEFHEIKDGFKTYSLDGSLNVAVDYDPKDWPQGRSRYIGAAKYVSDCYAITAKNQRVWERKFANGHGIGYAPQAYDPVMMPGQKVDPNQQTRDPMAEMSKAIMDVQSGGTMVLPSDTDQRGARRFEYSMPQTPTSNTSYFDLTFARYRQEASLALEVPPLIIDQTASVGSMALAKVHFKVFEETVRGLVEAARVVYQSMLAQATRNTSHRMTISITYFSAENETFISEIAKSIVAMPQLTEVAATMLDLKKLFEITGLPLGNMQRAATASPLDQVNFDTTKRPTFRGKDAQAAYRQARSVNTLLSNWQQEISGVADSIMQAIDDPTKIDATLIRATLEEMRVARAQTHMASSLVAARDTIVSAGVQDLQVEQEAENEFAGDLGDEILVEQEVVQ